MSKDAQILLAMSQLEELKNTSPQLQALIQYWQGRYDSLSDLPSQSDDASYAVGYRDAREPLAREKGNQP